MIDPLQWRHHGDGLRWTCFHPSFADNDKENETLCDVTW